MKVWLVKPVGYPHAEGLRHVAQAFTDALQTELIVGPICPEGPSLIFCGHLLLSIEPNSIIYNTEQISDEWLERNKNYKGYIDIMKQAKEVWDYSRNNIEELKKYGIVARLVEVGYMPSMTKDLPNIDPDIDVLFYGSTSCDRRRTILEELKRKCKTEVAYGVYGDDLDKLIARSKIVLNMHFYETAVHEIFRTSYLMANRKQIVSETSSDSRYDNELWMGGMAVVPYHKLVGSCLWLLETEKSSEVNLGDKLFEYFSSRTQIDILKEAGVL